MAFRIIPPENIEGLVGEYHAEPERIIRLITLINFDQAFRAAFLRLDRKIEARRAAAEN
jgi:hypothetical protein